VDNTYWDTERYREGTWSSQQSEHFSQLLEQEKILNFQTLTKSEIINIKTTITTLSTNLTDGIRQLYAIRIQVNKVDEKITFTLQPLS
jgi:hypothetical protein